MSLRSEVIRIFNELIGSSKKISDLPAAGSVDGTELVEIVKSGQSMRATASQIGSGGAGVVQTIVAGTNITVDDTDPANPIISSSGGGGSGTVESVTGDGVDNTDPDNPVLTFPNPGDIGAATTGDLTTVANALSAHIADTTDAHDGSAITNTPAGNVVATTVQGAINELDSEKAPLSSPALTGTPTAPTAATTTNTTQIATTAFVQQELAATYSDLDFVLMNTLRNTFNY